MSSFEIGASRPVGAVQLNPVSPVQTPAAATTTTTEAHDSAPVHTALATSAGQVPVDQTRVARIRQAVESGTYPLIPAKVGDAMVAAGILLQRKA